MLYGSPIETVHPFVNDSILPDIVAVEYRLDDP
jgi:hypothetical protein